MFLLLLLESSGRERERLTARVKERKEFGLNDNLSRGKTILEESE